MDPAVDREGDSHVAADGFALEGFDGRVGVVPVFPLPDLVLFPCSLLPLHIFEARFRQMVKDALAGRGLIAMAKLRPGWESSYAGAPAVHDVVCVGKIVESFPHQDGRYNIVLCGARRARVVAFEDSGAAYRTARVALLADALVPERDPRAARLAAGITRSLEGLPAACLRHKNLEFALRKLDAPLGCLTDLVADALRMEPAAKQRLLEETDPCRRAQALLDWMAAERLVAGGLDLEAAAPARAPHLN